MLSQKYGGYSIELDTNGRHIPNQKLIAGPEPVLILVHLEHFSSGKAAVECSASLWHPWKTPVMVEKIEWC